MAQTKLAHDQKGRRGPITKTTQTREEEQMMLRKVIMSVSGILLVLLFCGTSFADIGGLAVTAKAGTLGLGAEVTTRIAPQLNARVGINAFNYDYDGTEEDIKYNFDLQLLSFAALLDWHPFDGGFRISGGLLVNENEVDMKAEPTLTYAIGNATYTAAQVGTLTGNFSFNGAAPYAGIGWGNAFSKNQRWAFALDVGVVFSGSPKLDLSVNGPIATDATFLADLTLEEKDLEDSINDFDYYPVISVGVTYRF